MTTTEQTTTQAEALRHIADVLDSLPGLPRLYVVCHSTDASISIQVPTHVATDTDRIAAAGRLAEALGVTCAMDRLGDAWIYRTAYGVHPEVYAPKLSHEAVETYRARMNMTTTQ